MLLTETNVTELVTLATEYANSRNLDVNCYLDAILDPDNLGDSDAYNIVTILIRYHKEWLAK